MGAAEFRPKLLRTHSFRRESSHGFNLRENGKTVVTRKQVLAAAGVKPSNRTDEQKATIASDANNPVVRNANAEAARQERIYGKDR